jgi:O-antigen/teichoic acid export membrane protein
MNKIKQFFRGSLLLSSATVLLGAITYWINVLFARTYPVAEYGKISILFVSIGLLSSFGFPQGGAYFTAIREGDRKVFLKLILIAIPFSLLSYLLIYLFSDPISGLLFGTPSPLFRLGVAGGLFFFFFQFLADMLRGKKDFLSYFNAYLFLSLILFLSTFFLRYSGILLVSNAIIICYFLSFVITFFISNASFKQADPKIDGLKLSEVVKYSLPLSIGAAVTVLTNWVDSICVMKYLGAQGLGIYHPASITSKGILFLLGGLNTAAFPFMVDKYKKREGSGNLVRWYGKHLFLLCIAPVAAVLIVILFCPFIIDTIFGKKYAGSIPVLTILVFSVIFFVLKDYNTNTMAAIKKTLPLTIANVSGGVLNLILNLVFIPRLGIKGAAVAMVISSGFLFVSTTILCTYFLRIEERERR